MIFQSTVSDMKTAISALNMSPNARQLEFRDDIHLPIGRLRPTGALRVCIFFSDISQGISIDAIYSNRTLDDPYEPTPKERETRKQLANTRLPLNVQAIYLRPLRRQPTHGIPVCDLQLRTYSVRNMDLMADFAMRAAYYLNLPAKGPTPLPKITERWTVPKSHFVFKKSQENFERITLRRLIQIQDGHPDVVRTWLGVVMKYQYHGVGMKANVWEWDELGCGKKMDAKLEGAKGEVDDVWKRLSMYQGGENRERAREILLSEEFRNAWRGSPALAGKL